MHSERFTNLLVLGMGDSSLRLFIRQLIVLSYQAIQHINKLNQHDSIRHLFVYAGVRT